MSREGSLVKNTLIIGLGTFLPRLTALVTLPILTASLTTAEFGTFDLINSLISLLLPMVTLKIESAAFRFLIECRADENEAKVIISTMFLFSFIISCISLLVFYVFLVDLTQDIRLLICLFFLVDIINRLIMQVLRGFSKNLLFSINAIISSLIKMILIMLTVSRWSIGISGVLISTIFALIFSIIVGYIGGDVFRYFSIGHFSMQRLKDMLKYSWPMIPNALSSWIIQLSDRLIITLFLGIEATAVYGVANRIPNLFSSLQGTFILAWQENASLAVEDTDSSIYYTKIFESVFYILFGIISLLIAATPILFVVLIRGDYSVAYYQMPFLFIGMFFSSLSAFFGGIYVAHKQTFNVGVTTMIAACLNVIINFSLIHLIGIYASSIAMLISFSFLALYRSANVRKFQRMTYNFRKIAFCLGILIIMSGIIYFNNFFINILNGVIAIICSVYFNLTLVKNILRNLVEGKIKDK